MSLDVYQNCRCCGGHRREYLYVLQRVIADWPSTSSRQVQEVYGSLQLISSSESVSSCRDSVQNSVAHTSGIHSVYANSFLATLNARHSMRQGLSVGNSSSEGINSIRVENLRFAHGTAVRSSREVRVLGSAGGGIAAHGEGSATDVDIMEMESGSRGKDFKRKETVSVPRGG